MLLPHPPTFPRITRVLSESFDDHGRLFHRLHTAWRSVKTTRFYGLSSSKYDFRLKFLQLSNGFYVPGAPLTTGLTNRASYWTPDNLVTQTNLLWELDRRKWSRACGASIGIQVAAPERAAFAEAAVTLDGFQKYLRRMSWRLSSAAT